MVAVRVTRESIEVGALAADTAGVTRIDTEVATTVEATTTGRAAVTRVSIEVAGKRRPVASVTRVDTEVATLAQAATTGRAAVTRVSAEIGARIIRRASVTRLDGEVATLAQAATTGRVRMTRVSVEMLARRGASGKVFPLPLALGIEVFLHNWITESELLTRYSTDIATSPSTGAESRRGLVLKPERTLTMLWQLHADSDTERFRIDRFLVMLRKLTNERVAVPLYMDQRELDLPYLSTANTIFFDNSRARFFPGARVVIIQYNYEGLYKSHSFHLIQTMQDDRLTFTANLGVAVAARSICIPMIDCEVTLEARAKWNTALNVQITLELTEVAGASQLPPTKSDVPSGGQTFDGKPIFDYDPNWLDGIEKGRLRDGKRFQQGRTSLVAADATRSREWHKLQFSGLRAPCSASALTDIWRVAEFFDTRRGRTRSFWHIDQEQVWAIESIDPSGNFVGVHEINNIADFSDELQGGWLGLVMADGTMYVREAVTVQQVLTVFRITVSPSLPAGLNVNNVVRVARARPSRFLSDEIQEKWSHSGHMSTEVEIIETLDEENAEI